MPLEMRLMALAYKDVIEKATPGLEAIGRNRAEQKSTEQDLRARNLKRRG